MSADDTPKKLFPVTDKTLPCSSFLAPNQQSHKYSYSHNYNFTYIIILIFDNKLNMANSDDSDSFSDVDFEEFQR